MLRHDNHQQFPLKKSSSQYIVTARRLAGAPACAAGLASAPGSAAAGTAKKMRADIDMGQKNVAGKGPLWV